MRQKGLHCYDAKCKSHRLVRSCTRPNKTVPQSNCSCNLLDMSNTAADVMIASPLGTPVAVAAAAAAPRRRTVGTKRPASSSSTSASASASASADNDANTTSVKTAKAPRVPKAPKEPKTPRAPKAPKTALTTTTEVKAEPKPRVRAAPKPRGQKAAPATIVDAEVDADVDAETEAENETEAEATTVASTSAAAAAAQPAPTLKVRKQRAKPAYIRAFGDLLVKPEDRDNSRDAFETWRKDTKYLVDTITFTAWKQLKKAFYRDVATVGRHQKKKAKTQDVRKTSANHLARLLSMTAADFAELDDAWLSQYGYDGSYTTEQLLANGCPNAGASSAYVVFQAAMHFGVTPRGIVSEKSKNNSTTGELEFLEKVDGRRVYVGISLPFRGKSKSKFSVDLNDRAYEIGDAVSNIPAVKAAPKRRKAVATASALVANVEIASASAPTATAGAAFEDGEVHEDVENDADTHSYTSDDGRDDE